MKLSQEVSPVEISGSIGGPQGFAIAASKEAFKILSSGLYNNKKLAIVREICCNAYDAHVAAGKKEEPFELHLPTTFEPHFSVKDYGIGLSHEEVLSLYTTYFGTNKSNSNDFVGALGLGSKSPFCYTEMFSIVSRFNGKTRTYSCFINEQGLPSVLLQTEDETPDEKNGLEVSFPVQIKDCWEFENVARIALEFFNPKPIINTGLIPNSSEYAIKSDKWGLRKEASTHHTSGLRAVQGMVQYAVGNIDNSRMSNDQKELVKLPLDLFFDIGDLSVAASRETLSNDERTIGNILILIDSIGKTLLDDIKKKLGECKTNWEARLLLFSWGNAPGIGRIVNSAYRNGQLDGDYGSYSLSKDPPRVNELDYEDVIFSAFQKSWRQYGFAAKAKLSTDRAVLTDKKKLIGTTFKRENFFINFNMTKEVLFVFDDLGFGGEKYIHYFLQQANDNHGSDNKTHVYLIQRVNKDIDTSAVVKAGESVIKELGFPPFQLLSDMKARYKEEMSAASPAKSTVKKDAVFFNLDNVSRRYRDGYVAKGWRESWEPVIIPKSASSDNRYYVLLKQQIPQFAGEEFFEFADDFKLFIQGLISSNMFDFTDEDVVYGLNESSPFRKKDNWIELTSHVFGILNKKVTPLIENQLSLHLNPLKTDLKEVLEKIGNEKVLNQNSEMQKFCTQYTQSMIYDKPKLTGLCNVLSKAEKLGLYKVNNAINFNKKWDEILPFYPMLKFVDFISSLRNQQHIINYVKLVDEKLEHERAEEAVREQEAMLMIKNENILLEENILCQ